MDSIRQNKVARLIQKELGQYFQQEGGTFLPGGMISVTVVRVTPDMGMARIYLSVFPSNKSNEALEAVNLASKHIRFEFGKKVRHQLRSIPELNFFIDDSLDYAEHIEELLK